MESRFKRQVLKRALPIALSAMFGAPLAFAEPDDQTLLEDIVSPDIERRDIDEAKIDSENIEIGFYAGVKSTEDFGSNDAYGARLAIHITEDLFLEGNIGASTLAQTTYEEYSGAPPLLSEDERELTYYNLSLGYNVFPGEIYIGRWSFNTNFYIVGGAGNTLFADNEYFTYHFGGGFRLFLTDWLAFRSDFRNHVLTHSIFGDDKEIQNLELVLGLTLFF